MRYEAHVYTELETKMASLQQKTSHGQKYWYIVESRRVNGKPRPVVLEYLGKADALLERLQQLKEPGPIKSYSHGAVAALLRIANELDIVEIINQHVRSPRPYFAPKPLRNNLTVGATLLLGAIGRICAPTSKRGWQTWAKTTSCEYLLRTSLRKVDSQHFWDLMDALPLDEISQIETKLLARLRDRYGLETDTLFYDATNFFTFIATENEKCTIAKRGKNKQKRSDLRQVGLAMVVTREDKIPLFHLTYQGNCSDSNVFKEIINRIRQRMLDLGLELGKHTLVFDRGNNSKQNMQLVAKAQMHYVGALTPYQHKELVKAAHNHYKPVQVKGKTWDVFRTKRLIWGEKRTVVVLVSEQLKAGQWRGIVAAIEKAQKELRTLQKAIEKPAPKARTRQDIEARINAIVKKQFIQNCIPWQLDETRPDCWNLQYHTDEKQLDKLEDVLGLRILMTDRHQWSTEDIIGAFHGQANIENVFKEIKNPYHLAVRPQFHWTDQKIAVHFFMCALGYLMATVLLREARQKTGFEASMDTFLDILNSIRLAACKGPKTKKNNINVVYKIEEMDEEQITIAKALGITEENLKRTKIKGFSVYA